MVVKGLRGSQQTFNELIYFLMHKKQATQNHEDVCWVSENQFKSKLPECERKYRKRET